MNDATFPPATIVGAGPAGSLLGIFLARRGIGVSLYERRPDMRREAISAGRSINLALADRGIHALQSAGVLDVVRPLMIPMRGRMIHDESGRTSLQRYGQNDSEVIYSVSRADLNKLLLTELERTASIEVQFRHNCQGLDFYSGSLSLLDERDGAVKQVAAVPVIGADGASSAIRAAMLADGRTHATEEVLSHRYKELTIPAGPGGKHRMETNALHIWPRGGYMLIALPNVDGSFTVTLFLPAEGPESFATLTTPDAVQKFFSRRFADAHELIPDLGEEFFAHPTGTMVTVRAAPWKFADRAFLIGDAAHAIVPFHGQGMSSAASSVTASASSRLVTVSTPAASIGRPRVMTRLRRPGNALPMDSKVLRPISMGLPMVTLLKCLRSAGRCHGRRFELPITPFSAMATTSDRTGPDCG